MKSTFKSLVALVILGAVLVSCRSAQKPSLLEMQQEKMTLVQIVSPEPSITDVFGDSLQTRNRYYIYTTTRQLVPLSLRPENESGSIDNYLQGRGLLGQDGSDTISVPVGYAGTVINIRQYRLKGFKLSLAKLN